MGRSRIKKDKNSLFENRLGTEKALKITHSVFEM